MQLLQTVVNDEHIDWIGEFLWPSLTNTFNQHSLFLEELVMALSPPYEFSSSGWTYS
jgi:hypothetical protein